MNEYKYATDNYYRFECCMAPNKKEPSLTTFSSFTHLVSPPTPVSEREALQASRPILVQRIKFIWIHFSTNASLNWNQKSNSLHTGHVCIIAHIKSIVLAYRKRHQTKIIKNWNNSSWYRLCLYKRCIPFNREVTIFSSHICCLGKSEIALEITKWDS